MVYNEAEANECLTSLQMIGEGWWRSTSLALDMGAHLALGMTPREFVLSIGRQQMLDATGAIMEMKAEGVSVSRITAITGVGRERVNMILAGWRGKGQDLAEPVIEITDSIRLQLESGDSRAHRSSARGSVGKTQGDVGNTASEHAVEATVVDIAYTAELEAQISSMAEEIENQKQKVRESSRKNHELVKQAHIYAAAHYLTDEKREELREAAKKQMDGEQAELLQGLSSITLRGILSSLEHAQDQIQELRRDGHLDGPAWSEISSAMGNLSEEIAIARATLA